MTAYCQDKTCPRYGSALVNGICQDRWAVVWMTDDGPSVEIFKTEDEATQSLYADYVAFDRIETIEEAEDYYANSGDEWIIPVTVPM